MSHILRDKLRSNVNNNNESSLDSSQSLNHDKYIGKNFWGYVKNILSKKDTVLPSFNMTQCLSHFTKTLAAIHPNKLFNIPSWIPALSDPEIQFDLDPPSYQQVTNIIRRTKASGSPCPLDQLSVICFKRCPFLRTYLTDLIRAVWLSQPRSQGFHMRTRRDSCLASSSYESPGNEVVAIWNHPFRMEESLHNTNP